MLPYSFAFLSSRQGQEALPMLFSIHPFAIIDFAILPIENAFSMLLIILVLANIFFSIRPLANSISLKL
jgi:hypothetical protein